MKKIFALILYLLPFISAAQPTITQANLPVAGLVYVMGTDNSYSDTISQGGANQAWDYSFLANNGNDTTGFISSSGTPYAASFPSANLATYNPFSDLWVYFQSDVTGFYVHGLAGSGTPTGGTIPLNPPQLYAPVPFTFNDTRSNTSRASVDTFLFGFNARIVINFQDDFNADGYGTLIIPTGTYNNVLRVRITEVEYDSAYYDPFSNGNYVPVPSILFPPSVTQTTTYRWVQDQQPSYLLGITADSTGDTARYSEYMVASLILANNDLPANHALAHAYPNPANNTVYINSDITSGSTLIIVNPLGQEVEKRKLINEKPVQVDVSSYANGIYQFSIVSDRGKQSGRFTVRH